ncbi:MAG: sugar ABC transporter ATP-binding protein [Spirochaetes bacterium]|nr:sugar ABC transporter ATP-binding protein [Spirochaetota bacterium]
MLSEQLLRMEGINKSFPGVNALKDVRFEARAGEVHALLGENGAGKSTLMKILAGVYSKDTGRIIYKGKEINLPNPRAAQHLGIGIIHQELNLAQHLTAAQNIFIGREPRSLLGLMLDEKQMNEDAKKLFAMLRLDLDPRTRVMDLVVAKQQMIEIAKALSFNSGLLIMDEPTAALNDKETEELFRIIRHLKDGGVGIIYISHRMDEIKKIADRITVMRDGAWIDTVNAADVEMDQIINMMVGRKLDEMSRAPGVTGSDEVVLSVRNLNRGGFIKDACFEVHRGEILGFAGLMGAGRTEVARAVFGADRVDSGEIFICGKKVRIRQPRDAVKHGVGYLSEDRKRFGLALGMDVEANIALASMEKFLGFGGVVNRKATRKTGAQFVESLAIKTPSLAQKVRFLSGGNQQKVIIAKWIVRNSNILFFDEPTRGIDVGAKFEVYKLLNRLAAEGKTVIMISSEMLEVIRLCTRVLVMCEGRITGELSGDEITQENILRLATLREAN